jgi:PPK2 family polyphosphate:nucleotide phosphotransferase
MIKLNKILTTPPEGVDKSEIRKKTNQYVRDIAEYQEIMYAERKQSLLVVLQGMDTSGKDGATRNVFKRCSPAGVGFYAFKKPTDEEFAHDFLWRVHKHTPRKGEIMIFNRSHYEDILIQRVHGWISEEHAKDRIRSINAFENLISYDNNTTILKFYMHLSPEKQLEKLQRRIDKPEKNYKHNQGDWEERKLWNKYIECYENAIHESSIPWHIVPVDERWYRDFIIAKKVAETLASFNMKYPVLKKEF